MQKNELALELTKLVIEKTLSVERGNSNYDCPKIVTDTYNYILENIVEEEK